MKITADVRLINMTKAPNLKAGVSVTVVDDALGELTIRDIRLNQKNDDLFLSFPQRKYTDKQGKEKYADIVTLSKTLRDSILRVVLNAYSAAQSKMARV